MERGNSIEFFSNMSSKFHSSFQLSSGSFNVIAACIVNIIFALGGTFLSSLVMFVFLYSSQLKNKTCHFLIMVLSCIDLVVVVVIHPLGILYAINKFTGNHVFVYETLYGYSISIAGSLSASAFLVMNTERYITVAHPFFHQRTVTNEKLLLLVGLFWIFTVTP